jgi:hypothetical protein
MNGWTSLARMASELAMPIAAAIEMAIRHLYGRA